MRLCPELAAVLIFLHASVGLRIVPGTSSDCSQQGLRCKVSINNCMDRRLSNRTEYIPAAPQRLEVAWETHEDAQGNVFPILHAQWNMVDDGSVSHLSGTELNVLQRNTNQNLCVRYSFFQLLTSRNPAGEKWAFSASTVMVEPGQTYHVSVFNIPKPEPLHSGYNVYQEITVPDCRHPRLKKSKFCVESGSLWTPNITNVLDSHTLSVGFDADAMSERYGVLVSCQGRQQRKDAYMSNVTSLSVTFNIKDWPEDCCNVEVQIQPFFLECRNDCSRRKSSFSICAEMPLPYSSSTPPIATYSAIGLGGLGLVLLCAGIAYVMYATLKPKKDPGRGDLPFPPVKMRFVLDQRPPKLLVIYSQDHPLYRTVVLNLCAFLKSKCGTDVLVDLLDSTMVGAVGPTRWLEWQRQQLKNPVDKILVLCSRGVQAKWRAMCGEERVLLREDVLSPNDDMLVPFLNLILSNVRQPAAQGKYIVAYFEDLSDERDVPSVFDIAVKYRLMKHFEELYFRILEIEKYQPGRVNHIEGIGKEEYFNCPSGKALRDAIEAFRAYQVENPDWFEAECVASEEDAVAQQNLLNKLPEIPSVLECVPLIRGGPPVLMREVKVAPSTTPAYMLTAELNHAPSVVAMEPRINPASPDPYLFNTLVINPPTGSVARQRPHCGHAEERVLIAGPSLRDPPQVGQRWLGYQGDPVDPGGLGPTEDDEYKDSTLVSHPGTDWGLDAAAPPPDNPSCADNLENLRQLQQLLLLDGGRHPVEVGEEELLLGLSAKGPSTGSDQGYDSKESSQRGGPELETDPLMALARLQEELFQGALT